MAAVSWGFVLTLAVRRPQADAIVLDLNVDAGQTNSILSCMRHAGETPCNSPARMLAATDLKDAELKSDVVLIGISSIMTWNKTTKVRALLFVRE